MQKQNIPLTKKQRDLVGENHLLAVSFFKTMCQDCLKLPFHERQGIISALRYKMVQAVKSYDERKGRFSTYMYRSFFNALKKHLDEESQFHKRHILTPFEKETKQQRYLAVAGKQGKKVNMLVLNEVMSLVHLEEREKHILKKYYYYGKSLQKIGDEENLSNERIRQIISHALEKIRKVIKDREYDMDDFLVQEFAMEE